MGAELAGSLWIPLATSLVWMAVLRAADTSRRYKMRNASMTAVLVGGLLSIPLATLIYSLIGFAGVYGWELSAQPWIENIFIVGPVEEVAKFLVFLAMVRLLGGLSEAKDGMIHGATVALGFSVVENIGYGVAYGASLHLWRSVVTTPGHMIYGALWGYAYGRVVTRAAAARTAPDFAPVYAAVGWTAVLHGIYNTFVGYGHADLGMLIDMLAALAVLGLLRELSINSPYYAYPLSQYRTAIPAIRRGLRLEPNNAVLYRRLGLYLLYARRYETAVKAFDEYLKRRPGSVYVQVYRAVAMFLRGYTDIARESIRKLVGGLTRSDRSRIRRHVAKLVRDKEARAELLPVLDPERGTATHRPRRVPNGTRVLVDRRLTERKEDGARPRQALAASSRKS